MKTTTAPISALCTVAAVLGEDVGDDDDTICTFSSDDAGTGLLGNGRTGVGNEEAYESGELTIVVFAAPNDDVSLTVDDDRQY